MGVQIKKLRQERGLSVRALAALSKVTAGAISQIENNRISPSVSTLKNILTGLDTSLADFFSACEEATDPAAFIYRTQELVNVSPQPDITYLGLPARQKRAIQILFERLESGAWTGEQMLRHRGEEGGFCVTGAVELTVDGQSRVLGPGDAYYFESDRPHSFRNVGRKPAVIVSACTPCSF